MDSSTVDAVAGDFRENALPAGREEFPEGMELKVRRLEEEQQLEDDSSPAAATMANEANAAADTKGEINPEGGRDDRKLEQEAGKIDISGEGKGDKSRGEGALQEEEDGKEKTSHRNDKFSQENGKQKMPHDSGAKRERSGDEARNAPRYKKRKIAMFVSYSGCGYQGMQRNKGCKTIEGDLEEALFKAGAIAESTFGDPRKIDWARAARTDKGVSAAAQVVSGRFFIDPPGFVERVNSHLPEQIRVLGFTRVTGTFSAKNLCDRRRYEYVLPVFALDPASHRIGSPVIVEDGGDDQGSSKIAVSCSCSSSDLETGFSFGDEQRSKLTRILQNFVGTHYFHNFTCRVKAEDPSTQRYIISYEASDKFSIQGCEFVRCTVVGQSFMLHQIRKMIGLAVAVMRGDAPESIFETIFRRDTKIVVPIAPELGLFLDECLYTAYNQRFAETHDEVSLKAFEREIADFKTKVIYPHIASTEANDKVFARWLHGLTKDRFPDFASATPI